MKKYKKIAMFGGTFSPVHNGHIEAARAYINAVQPDALYIIPTAIPPHKERMDTVSDDDRLNMLNLAFSDFSADCEIVISDIEIKRGGKSYTIDTVKSLLEISESVCIFCGTDMFLNFDKWYQFDNLLKSASVAYMQREHDFRFEKEIKSKAEYFKRTYDADIVAVNNVPFEISSSEVRTCIENGDFCDKIPLNVYEYILKKGLYQS